MLSQTDDGEACSAEVERVRREKESRASGDGMASDVEFRMYSARACRIE